MMHVCLQTRGYEDGTMLNLTLTTMSDFSRSIKFNVIATIVLVNPRSTRSAVIVAAPSALSAAMWKLSELGCVVPQVPDY